MKTTDTGRGARWGSLLQNVVFTVLLITAAGLLAWIAREHKIEHDLTQNTRNTLSQPTRELLRELDQPIRITAFATPQDPRVGDLRKLIRDFVAPYQRIKADLTLEFVDPREQPKLAQAAGVRVNGEMVVEYGKRSQNLTTLSEEAFVNLLMRLARGEARVVMSLDGHGERSLRGEANHDLNQLAIQLDSKGFRTSTLNLQIAQDIPDNLHVLIIAGPRVDLLPTEVKKIMAWVRQGGNLLWLVDEGSLHGLQPLAEMLGLEFNPGVVVDPTAQQLNSPPTFAVAAGYGAHPITRGFRLITMFPFARQVTSTGFEREFRATSFLDVAQRGWLEMDKIGDSVTFNKGRDVQGPVSIGLTIERELEKRRQRIAVIGTGHFVSNQYLGTLGNLDLGINIMNWLAGDEQLIAIQPRATVDSSLLFGRTALIAIGLGFLLVLPLAFLMVGATIWWRRRRA